MALAHAGARVALVARDAEALSRVAVDIRAAGGEAAPCPADVTDALALERAFDAAQRACGPPDCVLAGAGLALVAPLVETDPASFTRVLHTNVLGVFLTLRAAIRSMAPRG